MENIKLEKPYVFEGQEYTEIETSKLETLTVQDAMNVVAVGTGKYAEIMARMEE